MVKTFKYRLFPTKAQRTRFNQTLESCRWVYNKALEARKNSWENDKILLSRYDTFNLVPIWKAEKQELKDVYVQVLRDACTRVDLAFQSFFRRVKAGEKPGYPRFKAFGRYDSFTFTQGGFKLSDKLSLLGIDNIKIKLHRPIEGKIKTLTIQRDSLGNWYACLSCQVDPNPLPVSSEMVGIDLGLSTFATLSNGETIPRKRWVKQDEKDLKRIQRKIEKLAKGTPERRKAIKTLNHIHTRIKNRRNNFAHQESRKLINRYGLIVLEKLQIKQMGSNGRKNINRGITDVAWGQFVSITSSKAAEAGRGFLTVSPRGTTQECSGCNEVVPKDLSVRVHSCNHCGLVMDRDLNAAKNILARGLTSLGNQSLEAPTLVGE